MDRYWEFFENSIMYIKSDLYPGGEFIPQKEGRLSLWDRGFRHGLSPYDAGRTFRGKPWQIDRILSRFMRTLKASHMNIGIHPDEMKKVITEVCERNVALINTRIGEDFSYLIEATPGEYGVHGHPLPPPEGKGKPTFLVRNIFLSMKSYANGFVKGKGLHLVTPSTRKPSPAVIDAKIKTHSRHFTMFALHETSLVDPNAYPLFLDRYGNLTETNMTNIFLVYKGVLMTPSDRGILEGNGRANVLQIAKILKIPVVERDLQPFHLYNADEAFMSSEARFLSPVSRYNGAPIGEEMAGTISVKLLKAFIKWINYDITGISYLSKEERATLDLTLELP